MAPSGLYARLCHAFLVVIEAPFYFFLVCNDVIYRCKPNLFQIPATVPLSTVNGGGPLSSWIFKKAFFKKNSLYGRVS